MKIASILTLVVIMASAMLANGKSNDCFIVIGNKTVYCDQLQLGKANSRLIDNGSHFMKIPTSEIDAYAQDGEFYERLPVVCKTQDTAGWAFMQFIASHNGYRLYRFCSDCLHYDPATNTIAPTRPVYRYYTFKSGKFVSVTDDYNLKSELAKFGISLKR